MGLKYNLTLLLLAFITINQTFSQQYTFIPYGVEEDLVQSQAYAIEQDNKGYLWIGTLGGLSRFDGKNFVNFSTEDGLFSNHISVITILKDNRIIFAHPGGISYYNGVTFKALALPKSLSSARITCLVESENSSLLLGTSGHGFIQIFKDGSIKKLYQSDTFANLNIREITQYNNGFLTATRKGMVFISENKTINWWKPKMFKGISCSGVKVSQNTIWISTFGNGVFSIKNHQIQNYLPKDGLVSSNIRGMFLTHAGDLWFYSKIGISNFSNKNWTTLNNTNGLDYDNVFTITEDREGNIWLGSDGGGIYKFTGFNFEKYTTKDGLSSNLVMSILQDKDNCYWFSTYGQGITKFKNNKTNYYNIENSIGNNTVWGSLQDSKGQLWFCTSDGVYVLNHSKTIKALRKEDGLISSRITAIFEDSNQNVWLGAREGISMIKDDSIINFDAWSGEVGTSVRSFTEDSTIYAGTANGIYKFDGTSFKPFITKDNWCNTTIQCINKTQFGWWIGTSNGLHFYNGDSVSCVKFNTNFSSNYINFIESKDRFIWVGTNNGLFKIDESVYIKNHTVDVIRFSKHEGFSSLETNLHASYIDNDSNLWFGTADGVFKYSDNTNFTNSKIAPVVHINDIQLFLETPDWESKKVTIDSLTGLPEKLTVKHTDNYFTFLYTGISFSNPTEIKYQFMLDGFDANWLPITQANFATYSNLTFGDYTFKVRCLDKYGLISQPATFSFTISPPFWRTWWFYGLSILGFSSIIIGIYRWRVNSLTQKRQTEALINQSKMLGLEQKTLNASMNRHFIFNSLNSIQFYINRQDKLSANKYLTRFAKLIRKNLDSTEDASNLLNEEIERLELYLSLELMRFKDKFEYLIQINETLEPETIYVPSMLLQPFVENSIWHGILPSGKKGLVKITIDPYKDNRIKICISDNGIGINQSLKAKSIDPSNHKSKGMSITNDRILLLKKMTGLDVFLTGPNEIVEGNIVKGTTVELVLPKEAAELYY